MCLKASGPVWRRQRLGELLSDGTVTYHPGKLIAVAESEPRYVTQWDTAAEEAGDVVHR